MWSLFKSAIVAELLPVPFDDLLLFNDSRFSTNFPVQYLKLVSAIFQLFSKNTVFLDYFERNTLKRNLTYSCFIFPMFQKHLFSPDLPRAALLKFCFEKITMCNRDNACDVAASPDISGTKRSEPTNKAQIKIKLQQFLERI